MIYDIESYILRIQAFLQANLNTAITDLNTEKNDTIVLATISNDAYFIQTLNDTVANYNPHILIGIDAIQSVPGPGATIKILTFSVIILVEDRGQDLFIYRRMLRYLRVLEEMMNRSFNKIIPHATFNVNSLEPIALIAMNSNDPYRAVGVQIVASLG